MLFKDYIGFKCRFYDKWSEYCIDFGSWAHTDMYRGVEQQNIFKKTFLPIVQSAFVIDFLNQVYS